MKIIIDAMGGDNAPKDIIRASVKAVDELGIEIVLVGEEVVVKSELQKYNVKNISKITIHNAEEVISNDDAPVMAIKSKKDSSMVVGLNLLKDGHGDAFVSAGNTGALMTGALLIVKRIEGVDRPALAPIIPTEQGPAVLIDGGSNVDCKPINLLQFAVMGSIYAKKALNIDNPRVGLVNIGSEEKKGNELTKESYELLKNKGNLNFVGNIEGREVPEGKADVIVCDGFVGNVILKVMEGMGLAINNFLKQEFSKNIITKLGAFIAKSAFMGLKKKMDYKEYGGAILVGVNGAIIKAHGSADDTIFFNTIKKTRNIVESGLVGKIREEIAKIGE
ncbi:MAG TPA: phosphate acyltransferase PlsX [Lachnospiraceae bacterium]|nr:phosphate acyltransferase PlsX [Lachnospiraceae bacterium]